MAGSHDLSGLLLTAKGAGSGVGTLFFAGGFLDDGPIAVIVLGGGDFFFLGEIAGGADSCLHTCFGARGFLNGFHLTEIVLQGGDFFLFRHFAVEAFSGLQTGDRAGAFLLDFPISKFMDFAGGATGAEHQGQKYQHQNQYLFHGVSFFLVFILPLYTENVSKSTAWRI